MEIVDWPWCSFIIDIFYDIDVEIYPKTVNIIDFFSFSTIPHQKMEILGNENEKSYDKKRNHVYRVNNFMRNYLNWDSRFYEIHGETNYISYINFWNFSTTYSWIWSFCFCSLVISWVVRIWTLAVNFILKYIANIITRSIKLM